MENSSVYLTLTDKHMENSSIYLTLTDKTH